MEFGDSQRLGVVVARKKRRKMSRVERQRPCGANVDAEGVTAFTSLASLHLSARHASLRLSRLIEYTRDNDVFPSSARIRRSAYHEWWSPVRTNDHSSQQHNEELGRCR